jgi:hypothetical protein
VTIVDTLPVLAADLTFVKVNGGRAFADLVNWDEDADPYEGQRVLLADGVVPARSYCPRRRTGDAMGPVLARTSRRKAAV